MTTVDLNGIRETIRKLEEFTRLASDPAIAPFVHLNGDAKQHTKNAGNGTITPRSRENGLKPAVLEAAKEYPGEFTARKISEYLMQKGFSYSGGSKLQKAVGQVLRMLTAEHKLRVVSKGSGRQAVVYAIQ
jgi:hypothetical protein